MRNPVEITRDEAIRSIMYMMDESDPVWKDLKRDLKKEDTIPTSFEILQALGITKQEYNKHNRKVRKMRDDKGYGYRAFCGDES